MSPRLRRPARPERDDQGFVAVWTVAISVSILLILAFTADAGRILRARSDAYGTAAAAARFGASRIDERRAVADGVIAIDPVAARQAATAYLESKGYTGTVDVQNDLEVVVTVERDVEPHLPGVGTLHIEISATAEAIQVDPAALP